MTISEAALNFGCSPKFIQRYRKEGLLSWYAKKKPARGVRGIEPTEVAILMAGKGEDGHIRHTNTPAIAKVRRAIDNALIKAEAKMHGDACKLAKIFLKAAISGEDIDFLAYCIQKVAAGDEPFIQMVMGRKAAVLTDPIGAYAAKRLARSGRMNEVPEAEPPDEAPPAVDADAIDFSTLWMLLASKWRRARADVEPIISYNQEAGTAELMLAPLWPQLAPRGHLPELAGWVSVVPLPRIVNLALADSAATKISSKICTALPNKSKKKVAAATFHALLVSGTDGDNQRITVGRLLPADAKQPTGEWPARKATLKHLYDEFGMTWAEGRAFLNAIKLMSPNALNQGTTQLNENFDYSKQIAGGLADVGYRIPNTTVARVFGVSRQTVASWTRGLAKAVAQGGRRNRT